MACLADFWVSVKGFGVGVESCGVGFWCCWIGVFGLVVEVLRSNSKIYLIVFVSITGETRESDIVFL